MSMPARDSGPQQPQPGGRAVDEGLSCVRSVADASGSLDSHAVYRCISGPVTGTSTRGGPRDRWGQHGVGLCAPSSCTRPLSGHFVRLSAAEVRALAHQREGANVEPRQSDRAHRSNRPLSSFSKAGYWEHRSARPPFMPSPRSDSLRVATMSTGRRGPLRLLRNVANGGCWGKCGRENRLASR